MGPEQAIHRSILAMDIEGFSTRANPVQRSLRSALYELARAAAADAGLEWQGFGVQDAGDSILLFIEPTVPPAQLAGPYLRALVDRLAERTRQVSAEYTMRLRIALHHGLVDADGHGWCGDAVNLTARLLDADTLRQVLKAAGRAQLVFIVSDGLYRDVIRHQYRAIDTAAYRSVSFDVKQQHGIVGWVYVPGYPSPPGLGGEAREQSPPAGPGPQRPSTPAFPAVPSGGFSFTNNGTVNGGVAQVKNVYGDEREGFAP
ncbi:adenylate/guanylate cyclase domain-containing protein [Actinocrinis puniceicyclus]|uniref:Adenylate/guanylate cyclase domain-containing protein n=1 Tax=Actinocrinis puniceicyclus TaxID=977794 RepID=A0A8J7WSL4_9ACTN|nr:adenylate/guanylate cyclase domain-containing protein [Actinocrinis puniceicyclus]MBS2965369.1 adenylate/guanylate cyclase domain-containing protein [Actinocrinis puniceicyclus]